MCYCMWCAALVLLDVVGSGCGALRCRVRAPPHAVTHDLCSPEDGHNDARNMLRHLIVASCWFSLSLHNLLTMHGHRNLKLKIPLLSP